jgi:hypothetical protein
MVKKIKRAIRGAESEDDLVRAILAINQTPIAQGRPSPAQLHLGRNIRDELNERVYPLLTDWQELKQWKEQKKAHEKTKYDRAARDLPDLSEGQRVWVRWEKRWKKATVLGKIEGRPRSYRLRMHDTEREVERNRVTIRERFGVDDNDFENRKINPVTLFSQEVPPRPLTVKVRTTIAEEETDVNLEPTYEPPLDNENYQESTDAPPDRVTTTSSEDTGSSTSKPSKPPKKKKPKAPKPPIVPKEPVVTVYGRESKKPDRLIETM